MRLTTGPANIYLFKVNNRNNKITFEMCFKLTKKNQDEAIDVILVSLSLTYFIPFSTVSIVDFGLVNVYCEDSV